MFGKLRVCCRCLQNNDVTSKWPWLHRHSRSKLFLKPQKSAFMTIRCLFNKTKAKEQTGKSEDNNFVFQNSYVNIVTSRGMWHESPDGLAFDVCYQYFRPDEKYKNPPLVLALHDSPGSSINLFPMLEELANIKCQVIAPDFPGKYAIICLK